MVAGPPVDPSLLATIQDLFEQQVQPHAAADGGEVRFERFDPNTGIVWVSMHGACESCASSTVTLKFMVKRLLQHHLDEVTDVELVEDQDEEELD